LCDEEWVGDEDDDDDESDDEGYGEGNSMTLRDILLKAGDDVTQFDLLGQCLFYVLFLF
jgi:hypothetical protein